MKEKPSVSIAPYVPLINENLCVSLKAFHRTPREISSLDLKQRIHLKARKSSAEREFQN